MTDSEHWWGIRRLPIREGVIALSAIFSIEWAARTVFFTLAYLRAHVVSEGGPSLIDFSFIPLFTLFRTISDQPLIVQFHTRSTIMMSPRYLLYLAIVSYSIATVSVVVLVQRYMRSRS